MTRKLESIIKKWLKMYEILLLNLIDLFETKLLTGESRANTEITLYIIYVCIKEKPNEAINNIK